MSLWIDDCKSNLTRIKDTQLEIKAGEKEVLEKITKRYPIANLPVKA